MANTYFTGVILAILGGVVNSIGVILQKKVVNEIPKENRDEKFIRTLFKSPLWILGFIFIMVFSAIFFLSAQVFIGGALVPGLAAMGMIVLVIGSIKIIGEQLKKSEIFGIALIIIAIFLIALSELSISGDLSIFYDIYFNIRITVLTTILCILWMGCRMAGKKYKKVVFLAFSAGLPFAIGNIWLQPFTISMGMVFSGNAELAEIIIFIISLIIVVPTSFLGVFFVQEAFKYGDASKISPIQQMPIQIVPIFLYFVVYLKNPPNFLSIIYITIGLILILISGFLLAQKQAALEAIE
ncbi:MAG: hypothetical protein V3V33_04870 [Candidatus Lokiarchaeia archaeon]